MGCWIAATLIASRPIFTLAVLDRQFVA